MTISELTMTITLSQPSLRLDAACAADAEQSAVITFGRWFKGDKGEKGDKGDKGDPGESWDADFETATDEDIDGLFE